MSATRMGVVSVESILLFVLAAVAVIVVVRWVADRIALPAAALLPIVGITYALLPGPNVALDPDIILTFVLPPLLYSAALDSSLLAIRRNLRTVVSLSVVLVLLNALVIGFGFAWLVAGATLAAGIAVGATVAPPGPVAALAVGRRVGLPPKLLTLIQGEGLLNDVEAQEHDDIHADVIETMREQLRARLARYQGRLDLLRETDSTDLPVSPRYEAALHVRRVAIDAQREELLRWRDAGRLPDDGLRILERELDHEERLLPDRPARR